MKTLARMIVSLVAPLAAMVSAVNAQQDCGPPASSVVVASAVCGGTTRISWTNPPGLIFPKVWRSSNSSFANAVLVYNPGLLGATVFNDVPPQTGRNYFYWIGGEHAGSCLTGQVTSVPKTGPLPAGVFTINSYPVPNAVATCNGVQLTWQPSWDATGMQIVRVGGTSGGTAEFLDITPAAVSSFLDSTARAGNIYIYALFPRGACGDGTLAPTGTAVQAGPVFAAAGRSSAVNVGQQIALLAVLGAGNSGMIAIPPPGSFSWRRGGVPLTDNAKYSGVNTSVLLVRDVQLEDGGEYEVVIGGLCGPDRSVSVVLSVTQSCRADFDQSGTPTIDDIFIFLRTWFAGCP